MKDLLLACPCLAFPSALAVTIACLPESIQTRLNYRPTMTLDETVEELLRQCPYGTEDFIGLLEVISFFDKGSVPFSRLERHIAINEIARIGQEWDAERN